MAEIEYSPEDEGWFPVSRRFTSSSRWISSSLQAIKLMVYLLERASHPFNPFIGDVLETVPVIASRTGLSQDETRAAIQELLAEDANSQSQDRNGAFIEELTRDGNVVGYRLVNFIRYNPKAVERSEARKAQARVAKAKHAANTRWAKATHAIEEAIAHDTR